MKVLFATDGSNEDQHARDFVASAPWAAGTQIELLGVTQPFALAMSGDQCDRDVRDFEHELDQLAISLPRRDCAVTWHSSVGEPADEIASRAVAIEADLIVVGSRGRGPLATSILGSVSAGVIDRAPCPVLVARTDEVKRILFADDGSAGAATVAVLLDDWPILADASLQVVSVVDVGRPPSTLAEAPMLYLAGEHLHYDSLQEERERAERTVATRAKGLRSRSRALTTSIREGDAADEILAAAHDFAADLIVVGSRGQTGLARFLAGSVARRILLGAKCSVLVARGSAQMVRDLDRAEPSRVLALSTPWSVRTP